MPLTASYAFAVADSFLHYKIQGNVVLESVTAFRHTMFCCQPASDIILPRKKDFAAAYWDSLLTGVHKGATHHVSEKQYRFSYSYR